MWSSCSPLALTGIWLSCGGWWTLVCLTRGSCCVIKCADFHFDFWFFFGCQTDSGESGKKNSQMHKTELNDLAEELWMRNLHMSQKCKMQRDCMGLVSPIIEEGLSSKDGGLLLYMCVAVSDKQELFSLYTQRNCVSQTTLSLFCSQQ